jgi:hypothetical protein
LANQRARGRHGAVGLRLPIAALGLDYLEYPQGDIRVHGETIMSIRAIPLLVFAFILYNIVVLGMGVEGLNKPILDRLRLLSGGEWTFTVGDFILLITLFLLFIEIVKATFTTTSTLVDHALSMIVFVAILVEFMMVQQAATSVFFLIMMASLIDVIAGYTIGIRVARRDLNIGADH